MCSHALNALALACASSAYDLDALAGSGLMWFVYLLAPLDGGGGKLVVVEACGVLRGGGGKFEAAALGGGCGRTGDV